MKKKASKFNINSLVRYAHRTNELYPFRVVAKRKTANGMQYKLDNGLWWDEGNLISDKEWESQKQRDEDESNYNEIINE